MCYSFSKKKEAYIKTIERIMGKSGSRKEKLLSLSRRHEEVFLSLLPLRLLFSVIGVLASVDNQSTVEAKQKTTNIERYYFVIFNRNFPSHSGELSFCTMGTRAAVECQRDNAIKV